MSLKGILFILFASFTNPVQLTPFPVRVHETTSSDNHEELLPRLKPCDSKRQRLDFPIQSRTSLGRSAAGHKNMQQMIESFLDMPDNEADAPA